MRRINEIQLLIDKNNQVINHLTKQINNKQKRINHLIDSINCSYSKLIIQSLTNERN